MNHCCIRCTRGIVSTENGSRPRLASGANGVTNSTNADEGTTRFTLSRISGFRVRFVERFRQRSACFTAHIFLAAIGSTKHIRSDFMQTFLSTTPVVSKASKSCHLSSSHRPQGRLVNFCVLKRRKPMSVLWVYTERKESIGYHANDDVLASVWYALKHFELITRSGMPSLKTGSVNLIKCGQRSRATKWQ